ncbi:hypothetical protein GF420_08075 [candidate division GN15 bacterium]|nr:hypothetical protein [candidate division GN15 bacterium]
MEALAPYLIAGAAGLIIFAAMLTVRRSREKMEMKLQQAGFFRMPQLDPELKKRVERLISQRHRKVFMSRMYRYSGSNAEIYLADPNSSTVNDERIAVRSSNINLPRLLLFPKLPFGGKLVGALMKLGESAISDGLPRVDMSAFPEFDKRYMLFGEDPAAVRDYFTDQLVDALTRHEQVFRINGERDLFLFQAFRFSGDMQNVGKLTRGEGTNWREVAAQADEITSLLATTRQEAAASGGWAR